MANGYRDPAEIEREIHETQARMSRTMDAIQQRLQPRRMMNQVSSMFRNSNSGGFTQHGAGMGDTMRENSLPLALIGLGIGWLVWSNTSHPQIDRRLRRAQHWAGEQTDELRHRAASGYRRMRGQEGRQHPERYAESFGYGAGATYGYEEEPGTTYGRVPDRYRSDMGMAYAAEEEAYPGEYHYHRDTGPDYRERTRQYGEKARGTARHYTEEARHTAGRYTEEARHAAGRYTGRMRQGMRRASDQARHYSQYARESYGTVWHTIEDHPLMSGAVGFLIGAAIGAAIPSSRYEDEWLGEYRDAMMERGREYGSEAVDRASAVATHAAEAGVEAAKEAAREEAEHQGMAPRSAEKGSSGTA